MPDSSELTQLLHNANGGDEQAMEQVIETVYRELHRLASKVISGENAGHTLQATALVNEAYLKLFGDGAVHANDSQHFFALAARQMRRILVDHARAKHAQKRGGMKISLDDICQVSSEPSPQLVALDESLKELDEVDPDAARIVELRFFGGYTETEAAKILGIHPAKARRDFDFAKAWLYGQLAEE